MIEYIRHVWQLNFTLYNKIIASSFPVIHTMGKKIKLKNCHFIYIKPFEGM